MTRANEIGANSYLLEIGNTRIILDSGLHPKRTGPEALPRFEDLPPDSVDAIIVTHSHLDHVGSLPILMQDQPSARVFMTPPTAALADALLHNSVNVMKAQRIELDLPDYPLFTHGMVDEIERRFEPRDYEKPFELDFAGQVRATFYDAGHILGSAGVLIEGPGKRIFYTGDVHFEDHALIKGARFPELHDLDVLITETTRGDTERRPGYSRVEEEERFVAAINKALDRGGAALIPVFAIGKTQEVLTMIHECKGNGRLPDAQTFIGGLSTKMTVIYDKFADSTRRTAAGFRILRDMELTAGSRRRKRTIEYQPGCIFALSSGMMTEKTVSNGFARHFLDNPKNSLLFVGYADEATPGGRIRAAKRGDPIDLDPELPPVTLDCDVEIFDFSGHAPRDQLRDFMLAAKAKMNLLVHGDPAASQWFADHLDHSLMPPPGERIPL
ncbi:MAG: MBL fold metallo-hydrolase [Akkermansiaceae bacterium]|nr:MBL fold metallo-hydrolase [Akkermansiaceae bacterium]